MTLKDGQSRTYAEFSHQAAADFLKNAAKTGCLGSGPTERDVYNRSKPLAILATLPWWLLSAQAVWSSVVTIIAYVIARSNTEDQISSFSMEFWSSKLLVPESVTSTIGWPLFVLLSLFLREASTRFFDAREAVHSTGSHIRRVVRYILQCYPPGTWHCGDLDRVAAHLVAYPIALKMGLRGEREHMQLQHLLHHDDIEDILHADVMHAHCLRVVRSYLLAAEDDGFAFRLSKVQLTPAGTGVRRVVADELDDVDRAANKAVRIAEFRPAIAYVNHLRMFLHIWLMFLPLSLIQSAGWFTIPLSLPISYGISMLFSISEALNDPFGFDPQDIRLNSLCAEISHDILANYVTSKMAPDVLICSDHDTPLWLERGHVTPPEKKFTPEQKGGCFPTAVKSFCNTMHRALPVRLCLALFLFIGWCSFVVFLTWGITRDQIRQPGVRWWELYIPITNDTKSYISLGLFLLLSFWLNDAYRRYWRGLQIWQTELRPKLAHITFLFCVCMKRGMWHKRDRERILSHLAAFPYAMKQYLRGSRDLSEFQSLLSPHDIAMLSEESRFPSHIWSVIHAYVSVIDRTLLSNNEDIRHTFGASMYMLQTFLPEMESLVGDCSRLQKFPISPALTAHLQLFTIFWLALLPWATVSHDGFLSFLYLTPICYSIIKLLTVGNEIADPFGFDSDDLPLDDLCKEMREEVLTTYQETVLGLQDFVRTSTYGKEPFTPKARLGMPHRWKVPPTGIRDLYSKLTKYIKGIVRKLPHISVLAQVIFLVWSIAIVSISWFLSLAWDDARQEDCPHWCSAIDIEADVLGNVGFALFLILVFRASDGMSRYEEGAAIIFGIEMNLRVLAMETIQAMGEGGFSDADKRRLVAHLIQIPLCFKDNLLGIPRTGDQQEGLLNSTDYELLKKSSNPVDHCLKTVEAYCLFNAMSVCDESTEEEKRSIPYIFTLGLVRRIDELRTLIARVLTLVRFPVIESYVYHQRQFTALWLALLPLAMTRKTGFYTIIWAQVISYGVFALDEIATNLVNPFGHDETDLPVEEFFQNAANSIIETVNSVNWQSESHVKKEMPNSEAGLGANLTGTDVYQEYTLAKFNKINAGMSTSHSVDDIEVGGPQKVPMKPSLYFHILRSVPFLQVFAVSVWMAIVSVLSFVTRDQSMDGNVQWWSGSISVSAAVATHVSFSAFTTLGFYVRAASNRYHTAGSVWGDHLRRSCHALTTQILSYWNQGRLHEGDHHRVIAHIAALPLALKSELRGTREIRDLKGLLSYSDLGRIHCAESMSAHCLNVIRAYFYKVTIDMNSAETSERYGDRLSWTIQKDLASLERAVQASKFLNTIEMAPGFSILVKITNTVWFLIVPFVLAELSGWLTVLWGPFIAYSLLGLFKIAQELQNPFGVDLNDLDLDNMANIIVSDVVSTYSLHADGYAGSLTERNVMEVWEDRPVLRSKPVRGKLLCERDRMSRVELVKEGFLLAAHGVKWWLIALVIAWSAILTGIAFLVNVHFPSPLDEEECQHWFCSAISMPSSVKSFIGFALLFLLAFRLNDSHQRYVYAIFLWQDKLVGTITLLTNRLFASYSPDMCHTGDLERISGHFSAFAICLMGNLRGLDYRDKLRKVLCVEDVDTIVAVNNRPDYCLDIIQAYLLEGQRKFTERKGELSCSGNELTRMMLMLRELRWVSSECCQMSNIQFPFGYVQHLRIFLFIWIFLLPLWLVESSGWLSIFWTAIIAYGTIGVETWAEQLSDPFGFDVSDVPLEKLCTKVVAVVSDNLQSFRHGVAPYLQEERTGFPVVEGVFRKSEEP